MQGFFKKEEIQDPTMSQGRTMTCHVCKLHKKVRSPKIKPYGNFKKEIMVIGEAPGESEDRVGKPWQGKAGRLLQETFKEFGIDLFEDCISLNSVNCRPEGNRPPTPMELNCCRDVKVLPAIKDYTPNLIILLGGGAVTSFLGHRWKKNLGGISKWRGWQIPDKDFKAWVCPTFHPSYVERMDSREVRVIWRKDIEAALMLHHYERPRFPKPTIHYIEDLSRLRDIRSGYVAFDYETTGLKPHSKGHRIICGSVAYDANNVFVFEMPKKKKERMPLIELLLNPAVDKIASNMKYEDTWSNERLGTPVRGWCWDTMLASHVLDNRYGISGLKFQAYVRLGELGYGSDVGEYLKAKYPNDINRIHELYSQFGGIQLLLEYCGLDSIYEYRVAMMQMEELEYDHLPF